MKRRSLFGFLAVAPLAVTATPANVGDRHLANLKEAMMRSTVRVWETSGDVRFIHAGSWVRISGYRVYGSGHG